MPTDPRTFGVSLAAAFVAACVLFGFWPELDLAVSGAFISADGGFWLAGAAWAEAVRAVLWNLTRLVWMTAIAGLLLAIVLRRPALWLPGRVWAFVLGLFLLGPGLLVNGILKQYWGRARPAMVTDFGGDKDFTPFYQITDECQRNCSFVSGEVSATVAVTISVLVMLAVLGPRLGPVTRRVATGLAFVPPVIAALQRIGSGRHFLSDAVFAGILTCVVALGLYLLLLYPPTRLKDGPRRIVAALGNRLSRRS